MMKSKKEEKKPNKHSEKKFKVTIKFSDDPEEEKMKRLFKVYDILLSKQDPLEHTDSRKKGKRINNMTNKKVITKKQKELVEEAARRFAEILIEELERKKMDDLKNKK